MRTIWVFFILWVTVVSCGKEDNKTTLDDFCNVIPEGWECEIVKSDFNNEDLPKNADYPVAIIKYKNPNVEFQRYPDSKINPSLILDLYPIKQKEKLIEFIRSQLMFSWCIPSYYGETRDYFVITSPCFINNGAFTEEANLLIIDLHNSLKSILEIKEYDGVVK